MGSYQESPFQNDAFLPGKSDVEWESAISGELQGPLQPLFKPLHRAFLTASLAVALASFTVIYLLWGCHQRLAVRRSSRVKVRRLGAGNLTGEGFCHGFFQERRSRDERAYAAAAMRDEEADVVARLTAGAPVGPGAPSSTDTLLEGWGIRMMPLEWDEKMRRSLHKMKDISGKCSGVFDGLSGDSRTSLVIDMLSLAVFELSGFSYASSKLDILRSEVGQAYFLLSQKAGRLCSSDGRDSPSPSRTKLGELGKLIKIITEAPTEHLKASVKTFKKKIVSHWELNRRTVLHLNFHFDVLLSAKRDGGISSVQANTISNVVAAVLEITNAVVEAGGSPQLNWFFGASSNPLEVQPQQIFAEMWRLMEGGQHAQPNSLEVPSSSGLVHRFREGVSPLVVSLRICQKLQKLDAEAMAMGHDQLEEITSPSLAEIKQLELAKALGWEPGVMPPQVAAQVMTLMDRLVRAATTCIHMTNALDPQDAVLLAFSVTRLAAVELANLAAAPSVVQMHRERIAHAYQNLVRAFLGCDATLRAIVQLELGRAFLALQILIEKLSRPPPHSETCTIKEYLVKSINMWRLSNLSTRKLQGLVLSIRPLRTQRCWDSAGMQRIVKAVQVLFEVRKRQILSHPQAWQWLESCHNAVCPGLLYTDQELAQAIRRGPRETEAQLAEISKKIEEAYNPPRGGVSSMDSASESGEAPQVQQYVPRAISEPNSFFTEQFSFNPRSETPIPIISERPQPPIARPVPYSRLALQQYPSAPPTPVPTVQLPEIYNKVDPQWQHAGGFLMVPARRPLQQDVSLHPDFGRASPFTPVSLERPAPAQPHVLLEGTHPVVDWVPALPGHQDEDEGLPNLVGQTVYGPFATAGHSLGYSGAEGAARPFEGADGEYDLAQLTAHFSLWTGVQG
ncbi:hypothetical protein Efla_001611 [Eimeria flavescens]